MGDALRSLPASDALLVEQVRAGSEPAFEAVYDRYSRALLGFCRHMLGSVEEAEDALQHTFAAAWRSLSAGGEREIALRPWLYTIARNRCMSILRARRELGSELPERAAPAASEVVERRTELRELLADLAELPDVQRAALLLSEAGDLSHGEIASILGCDGSRVKALVFRARSMLIARRDARATPCEEIREQIATLRGPALRRADIQLHLDACPSCLAFRDSVRRQRQLFAAALPVVPAVHLKSSVMSAAGIGAATAGAAAVTSTTGIGAALVAKIAVAGLLAGGGTIAGNALVEDDRPTRARSAVVQAEAVGPVAPSATPGGLGPGSPAVRLVRNPGAAARSVREPGREPAGGVTREPRPRHRAPGAGVKAPAGQEAAARGPRGRANGHEKKASGMGEGRRGPGTARPDKPAKSKHVPGTKHVTAPPAGQTSRERGQTRSAPAEKRAAPELRAPPPSAPDAPAAAAPEPASGSKAEKAKHKPVLP